MLLGLPFQHAPTLTHLILRTSELQGIIYPISSGLVDFPAKRALVADMLIEAIIAIIMQHHLFTIVMLLLDMIMFVILSSS